jgi:proteasome activator subunit 4
MFIVAAIQHVKIGDLSMYQSGFSLSNDALGESMMDTSEDHELFPDGTGVGHFPIFSKGQERSLVRDSTAGFAGKFVFVIFDITI